MVSKIQMTCDRCGGQCEYNESTKTWSCPYCGTKMVVKSDVIINNYAVNECGPVIDSNVMRHLYEKNENNAVIQMAMTILKKEPNNLDALEKILVCYTSKSITLFDNILLIDPRYFNEGRFIKTFNCLFSKITERICSMSSYIEGAQSLYRDNYESVVGCNDSEYTVLMSTYQYISGMEESECYRKINGIAFIRAHKDIRVYVRRMYAQIIECCIESPSIQADKMMKFIQSIPELETNEPGLVDELTKEIHNKNSVNINLARKKKISLFKVTNKTGLLKGFPVLLTICDSVTNEYLVRDFELKSGKSIEIKGYPGQMNISITNVNDNSKTKNFSELLQADMRTEWIVNSNNGAIEMKRP